jgi:hypothetical protein
MGHFAATLVMQRAQTLTLVGDGPGPGFGTWHALERIPWRNWPRLGQVRGGCLA